MNVYVMYRNHRGEIRRRRVYPRELRFGTSEYHPEMQWLLEVVDLDKQATRTFAMKDVLSWEPA